MLKTSGNELDDFQLFGAYVGSNIPMTKFAGHSNLELSPKYQRLECLMAANRLYEKEEGWICTYIGTEKLIMPNQRAKMCACFINESKDSFNKKFPEIPLEDFDPTIEIKRRTFKY